VPGGDPPSALPQRCSKRRALRRCSRSWWKLADRFEPALCDAYVRLFSHAIEQTAGDLDAAALEARYQRVRRRAPLPWNRDTFRAFALTLGADVAVTSVLLDAAKRRFPSARIVSWAAQEL